MEWEGVLVAIAGALDELWSLDIVSANNQMRANVATVVESVGGEAASSHLDSVLTVSVQSVHLELALDHL